MVKRAGSWIVNNLQTSLIISLLSLIGVLGGLILSDIRSDVRCAKKDINVVNKLMMEHLAKSTIDSSAFRRMEISVDKLRNDVDYLVIDNSKIKTALDQRGIHIRGDKLGR
jgi:hypothetical protein